jgi:hypothetical protein
MLACCFVILALLWRVALPHAPNFTPLLASLLFFGSRAERKWLWLPVALFISSDLYLNARAGYSTTPDFVITWLWYGLMLWMGGLLRAKQSVLRVAAISLAGSLSFFVVSPFMVWVVYQMYPKTLAGLATCFVAAIPFFRNQFAGDVAFTILFFSVPVLLKMATGDAIAGNSARLS